MYNTKECPNGSQQNLFILNSIPQQLDGWIVSEKNMLSIANYSKWSKTL